MKDITSQSAKKEVLKLHDERVRLKMKKLSEKYQYVRKQYDNVKKRRKELWEEQFILKSYFREVKVFEIENDIEAQTRTLDMIWDIVYDISR